MALLDPSRQDLYVACTGDSRAVAGIWEESEDGTGNWRVEVLTEDQTGRNPNEIKRCAARVMHVTNHFLTYVCPIQDTIRAPCERSRRCDLPRTHSRRTRAVPGLWRRPLQMASRGAGNVRPWLYYFIYHIA